jgi:GTP 3',8-cyclase
MAIKDWQSLLGTDGRLLTCLFENPGHDLVSMLRSGKSEYYIKKHIIENISFNCS